MILKTMDVSNFRCIRQQAVDFSKVTALVGPNGAGKSTYLHALNFFYTIGYPLRREDFYGHSTENPISVTLSCLK